MSPQVSRWRQRARAMSLNGALDLQRRQNDVQEPQHCQHARREALESPGASQLSSKESSSQEEQDQGHGRAGREHQNTEAQVAGLQDVSLSPKPGGAEEAQLGVELVPFVPLSVFRVSPPINRGKEPRHAQAEENIHGVAPGDIPDRSVGRGVLNRRGPRRECIRQRCAHRHQGDCRDLIIHEGQHAAKEIRHVADDDRNQGDHAQGDDEASPTSAKLRRRAESKQDLPRDTEEVHHPIC
mmetsp:Transcript_40917/g.118479  ORF Transcript_40917/g.118479 Transcript_40917/m.118479 type:complete len:240 (+) Transcript_40917:76-795(+)